MRHLHLDATSVTSPPPVFSCESRTSNVDATWIVLSGELDVAGVSVLRHHLDRAICATRLIVLDLRGLTFMDSAGVHVILKAGARALENQSRLVLLRGPVYVDVVFAYTNTLDRVEFIDLYETDHPAVRTLSASRGFSRSSHVASSSGSSIDRGLGRR